MNERLTASLEDYLETIYQIIADREAVKPRDIAKRMKVSGASVTGALHALKEKGLIRYAPYDVITLTPEGKAAARDVVRRHEVLRDFFVKVLAVESHEADEAACRMEHSIPANLLERFVSFLDYVEGCPQGGALWIEGIGYLCRREEPPAGCARCTDGARGGGKHGKREMRMCTINDLAPGGRGRVIAPGDGEAGRRLVEMGVTAGAVVEVERVAPFGDPMEIKVRGYHLSLRRDEAARVTVEPL